MNNRNDEIAMILEKIVIMQRASVREELEERFCDNGFLGEVIYEAEFNTRPIMLFTDDDNAWRCPVERDGSGCGRDCCDEETCVFRVERVNNNTVTLRALRESCRRNCNRFESTNSYKTIKLNNIAAIRCLRDTFVDLCLR